MWNILWCGILYILESKQWWVGYSMELEFKDSILPEILDLQTTLLLVLLKEGKFAGMGFPPYF